jgi:hypothetical protein
MPKYTDRVLLVIEHERLLVDPGKLLLSETIAAEKATGLTWPQIWVGVNAGQAQSIQAVVWLMRKRSNPRLRLSEVEFSMEDYRLKDPDFLPDYWIPEEGENPADPPESVTEAALVDRAFEPETDSEPEAPKAQDQPAAEA